jgi:hypothetical protein
MPEGMPGEEQTADKEEKEKMARERLPLELAYFSSSQYDTDYTCCLRTLDKTTVSMNAIKALIPHIL